MFEDIDWGTYFEVRLNGLTPNIDIMIRFEDNIAAEKKHDVTWIMFDFAQKYSDVKEFTVSAVDSAALNVVVDTNGKGQEMLEKLLVCFNDVKGIKRITANSSWECN